MFDAHFFAFAAVAALLVISPGATMVVVADAAIRAGRRGGLRTVAGVGSANASMAVACALGLSALFKPFPEVLHVVAAGGALYLAWLGVRAIVRAVAGERPIAARKGRARFAHETAPGSADVRSETPEVVRRRASSAPMTVADPRHEGWFVRGLVTNYSNPSVVLFYMVLVPQFITAHDGFVARYLLLGGTHVAMSVVWLAGFAISVGTLGRYMTRPVVRRTMDLVMGVVLLAFAVNVAMRSSG